MTENTGATAEQSNWLGKNGVPDEVKLIIFEHIISPSDLARLLIAYPEWGKELWNRYPKTLSPRAFECTFYYINPGLRTRVLLVYHIRRIRKEYVAAMNSRIETQAHRDGLQADLRNILGLGEEDMPELEMKLQTVLNIARVIGEVHCLTYRYSNDAWGRIHDIAEKTAGGHGLTEFKGSRLPEIELTSTERFKFNDAFLRVEIYLLTKFWTNAQGQRHILDMGTAIIAFIPCSLSGLERQRFDSCLRYIFDTHRGYLKKMARQMRAPELPARDDLQFVPRESEVTDYLYKDDGRITSQGVPALDFQRRSVSEEQRFLLWLCEFGISTVCAFHQLHDGPRKDQLLLNFGRRHVWDTVELRHRVTRYDVDSGEDPKGFLNPHRNRHPIKSLYGSGRHRGYTDTSSPWACATAFLEWEWPDLRPEFQSRGGITLGRHGRWLMKSDTDQPTNDLNPFKPKNAPGWRYFCNAYQYMLDPEKYELRIGSMPWRLSTYNFDLVYA